MSKNPNAADFLSCLSGSERFTRCFARLTDGPTALDPADGMLNADPDARFLGIDESVKGG